MAKWTVMIFMGTEGVEGTAPLDSAADADVAELGGLTFSPGQELSIWVERHGFGAPKRDRLGNATTTLTTPNIGTPISTPEAFATGGALESFMKTALEDPGVPAVALADPSYTMLVLWGHAYDFAFGRSATRFGIDALDYAELARVLNTVTKDGRKLDIIAFDSCSIATLEIAYQFAPYARYLIASQIGIPLPGWPYDRVFDRLAEPLGAAMDPLELGSYVVRRYCERYPSQQPVSLSHLDLAQAGSLSVLTDRLASALAIAMDQDEKEQELVSQLFMLAQTADGQPFVDVAALCRLLVRDSGDADVQAAAKALGDAVLAPVAPAYGPRAPFVIENGFNSIETAGLSGVSLYAPNVAPNHDFAAASPFYEKLAFARDTLWRDLVRALALPNQVCC